MQFGELLAAVRKAQANVMLFLEEKEHAALSQANGIKTHLEYRSAEMEKSKQELERMAAISNTVQFLEMRTTSRSTLTLHTGISGCRRTTAKSPTPHPGSTPTRTSPAGSCTGGRCCPSRVCTCTGTILRWRSSGQAPMLA
uniref:Tripartite motif containing 16 n=1 Tax=Aotus nancymaae TaxID=37293 RepID=A0A2K5DYN0_AOTNA